jgi:mRNA interferase RelE/StbE
MIYGIDLNKKTKNFLLKHEGIAKIFFNKIKILAENPYDNSLDIKKMHWFENVFRLRVWKYRFLYEIIEDKILIQFLDADSRWSIY